MVGSCIELGKGGREGRRPGGRLGPREDLFRQWISL
jgi:hypothetical protein